MDRCYFRNNCTNFVLAQCCGWSLLVMKKYRYFLANVFFGQSQLSNDLIEASSCPLSSERKKNKVKSTKRTRLGWISDGLKIKLEKKTHAKVLRREKRGACSPSFFSPFPFVFRQHFAGGEGGGGGNFPVHDNGNARFEDDDKSNGAPFLLSLSSPLYYPPHQLVIGRS